MKKDKFGSPDNYSVIIPYRDFEKIMSIANNYDEMHRMYVRLCQQYDALHSMYFELVEKIGDIQQFL